MELKKVRWWNVNDKLAKLFDKQDPEHTRITWVCYPFRNQIKAWCKATKKKCDYDWIINEKSNVLTLILYYAKYRLIINYKHLERKVDFWKQNNDSNTSEPLIMDADVEKTMELILANEPKLAKIVIKRGNNGTKGKTEN